MKITVTCVECIHSFEYEWTKPPRGGRKRRLCDSCVIAHRRKWRSYQPVVRNQRTCTQCGRTFLPYKTTSQQAMCSQACSEEARKTARREAGYWTEDRLRRWGLTSSEYDLMAERQGYSCAICGQHQEQAGRLVIDHDHSHCSGAIGCRACIRALLCGDCNRGLGFFRDNPFALMRALDYVNPAARPALLTVAS